MWPGGIFAGFFSSFARRTTLPAAGAARHGRRERGRARVARGRAGVCGRACSRQPPHTWPARRRRRELDLDVVLGALYPELQAGAWAVLLALDREHPCQCLAAPAHQRSGHTSWCRCRGRKKREAVCVGRPPVFDSIWGPGMFFVNLPYKRASPEPDLYGKFGASTDFTTAQFPDPCSDHGTKWILSLCGFSTPTGTPADGGSYQKKRGHQARSDPVPRPASPHLRRRSTEGACWTAGLGRAPPSRTAAAVL